jgi:flagellar basal-body rod protein FlgB
MKSSELSLFDLASRSMEWAAARQKTVATNVANADTPGYKAKDVQSFASWLDSGTFGTVGEIRELEFETSWGGSIDGNTVVVEEQMMLAGETTGQYQLAANLYKKGHALLRVAVSGE